MNQDILEKIKKLLRMKNGGSAGEIENALSLAQQLATKYGINLNSINPDEPQREPIMHASAGILKRIQIENKYAAMILDRFFNVNTFVNYNGIIFVGTRTNIEIAIYVNNFLIEHFRREWNTKRGRLRNRTAFMYGMYKGLYCKLYLLEPQIPQQEGIILSNQKSERRDYIQKYFGKTESKNMKPDHQANASMHRGYIAGKNTNINKGIKTSPETKLLNG